VDCPTILSGGARVVAWTPIDQRHRPTGSCRHFVAGELVGTAAGLAVCQFEQDAGFFLLGCNAQWETMTDTWHPTIEEAKAEAELEYEGVAATWQSHNSNG
jgi:hypothetical protein